MRSSPAPRNSERPCSARRRTSSYGDRDGYIIDPFGHGWIISNVVRRRTCRLR